MIRVFPRRTKWTPTDSLAFVGWPGLLLPPEQPVRISVTFTQDIPLAEKLYRAWRKFYSDVEMGGPAFGDIGGEFVPGRFVAEGYVCTSRGCVKECPWCFVPGREGSIRELPVVDGWNVFDNNLLACSDAHVEHVFAMLRRQSRPIKLTGGLDAELFREWHAELLRSIMLHRAYFACDYPGAVEHLSRVAEMLADFKSWKKPCYVMIGYNGESLRAAEKRLEVVAAMGFYPFAMLYKGEDTVKYGAGWKKLVRSWANPYIVGAKMKGRGL